MPNIEKNINLVRDRIEKSAILSGRNAETITLLAVSKGQPAEAVRAARRAGLDQFGENYLQEALDKIGAVNDPGIAWHYIGPIQSNKTRAIAENFAWVHSVDRVKVARRLSEQRPENLPPLNICLQVNIDGEDTKSGVAPGEALATAQTIAEFPGIRLRGLMAIPAPRDSLEAQRQPFARMAELLQQLKSASPRLAALDTLSMGMSDDLEAAIAEGATIVRVGTDIFGPRQALGV